MISFEVEAISAEAAKERYLADGDETGSKTTGLDIETATGECERPSARNWWASRGPPKSGGTGFAKPGSQIGLRAPAPCGTALTRVMRSKGVLGAFLRSCIHSR